ncbi:hypothetical protein AAC387_Pa09g2189 [Persea americana]
MATHTLNTKNHGGPIPPKVGNNNKKSQRFSRAKPKITETGCGNAVTVGGQLQLQLLGS